MKNDYEQMLIAIEKELLELKTASEYSSIRSSHIASPVSVTTGLYQITYAQHTEPIMSMFYRNDNHYCYFYGRTPSGNNQIVEVKTTYWDNASQQYITEQSSLVVVSNVPVVSITRV